MIEAINQIEWGFWEVAVAILFGVVGILWAIWERKRQNKDKEKIISFLIKNLTPMVYVIPGSESRIKVTFDGRPVGNVYVASVQVQNQGGIPIVENDFVTPLKICFGEHAEIMTYEVSRLYPSDLVVKLEVIDNQIEIQPLLLNPGEHFTLEVIGTEFERINLMGRIVGLKEFRELKLSELNPMWDLLFGDSMLEILARTTFLALRRFG